MVAAKKSASNETKAEMNGRPTVLKPGARINKSASKARKNRIAFVEVEV